VEIYTDGIYTNLAIYDNAENTVAWLKENPQLWITEEQEYKDSFRE